jgi:hypothetical protein
MTIFENQLANTTQQIKSSIYNNEQIRKEYLDQCKRKSRIYYGIPIKEVYEIFHPFPFKELIEKLHQEPLLSRTQAEKEDIANKVVPVKHLNNTKGVKSVLCQFTRFLKDHERKPKLKHFIDSDKVLGYFYFKSDFSPSGNTRRNNAQAFIVILKWLKNRGEFKTYESNIDYIISELHNYAEINKDLANRTRQTKNELERIIDGDWFAPGEEDAFVIWAINYWKQIVDIYIDEESGEVDEIQREDCFKLMDCLLTLTQLLNGGLRREVNASIDPSKIIIEGGQLSYEIQKEKKVRLNINSLPFPSYINNLIIFYIKYVLPKINPKNKIKRLWINRKGNPLEHKDYSKHFKRFIKKFNPALNINPIETRRQAITNLFGKRIDSIKGQNELIQMAERYYNVGTNVMAKYYNRFNYVHELQEIHNLMLNSMIQSETLNELNKVNKEFVKYVKEINIANKDEKRITRTVRLTPDDEKWRKYLLSKKGKEGSEEITQEVETSPCKKRKIQRKTDENIEESNENEEIDIIDLTEVKKDIEKNEKKEEINEENENDEVNDKRSEENEEYEVERILNHKKENGKLYFLIRWKGYTENHDSWIEMSELDNCIDLLENYLYKKL